MKQNEKIRQPVNKIFIASMTMLFLMSVPTGISMAFNDLKNNFSSAPDLAYFIKKNIPDDGRNILISPSPWQGASAAFYLGERPVYLLSGERIMCIEDRPGALDNRLAESGLTKGKDYIYIVASKYQSEYLSSRGHTFIYETPPAMLPEEDYVLYRIP